MPDVIPTKRQALFILLLAVTVLSMNTTFARATGNGWGNTQEPQTHTRVESQGDTTTGTIEKRGHAGSSSRTHGRSAPGSTNHTTPGGGTPATDHKPTHQRQPTEQELAAYREAMARWAHLMQICQFELNLWGLDRATGTDCLDQAGPPHTAPSSAAHALEAEQPTPHLDSAVLAQRAVATLTLPTVTPKVGPPPSVNQWHIAAVGYPLWLWTTGPDTRTTSVTLDGVTLTLTARRVATRFDMGEPDAGPVVCTTTTPWTRSVAPAEPSPECGYTYQHASITQTAPHGTYTIRATERWEVTWTALGATGVIPLQTSSTSTLPVGEIQTVRLH